ncbi:alpha/beta hydrolase family protein [Sphingobacterium pedocola]|uniref:Alpha/beta hydrolase n=1 Tax=Sphingobacterium pedocola TaxID=2082722 RepID=A0ABR9T5E0_9SPHI|nr:alpha/beta hydrolase [Sphingobacterium pedocola]MBE8719872.1 alpha/beta hydrolase [Sphingobacterium pedocola]
MKQFYVIFFLVIHSCLGYGEPVQYLSASQPYDTLEVVFTNVYDDVQLAGTLSFPKRAGRYPAVILLTGSGAQNRDEEISGHKPFKVITDYLTQRGIVVLRYDDRGVGKSTGQFDNSTIGDFSKDALAALAFLKKQNQVDARKIGFIGHSEGGLIAALLAGQNMRDLSFIMSLAGPAISIDQLMVDQLYAIGKTSGMSEPALEAARRINEKNFAIVKGDLNNREAYKGLMENMKMVPGFTEHADLLAMVSPAYRYFLRIEPEKYLKKITIPVFAAFGSLDVQVPSTRNLESLHRLLPRNPKSVLKEYEGLNHLFQQAQTGRVAEYAEIKETFNERVLSDMADWITNL